MVKGFTFDIVTILIGDSWRVYLVTYKNTCAACCGSCVDAQWWCCVCVSAPGVRALQATVERQFGTLADVTVALGVSYTSPHGNSTAGNSALLRDFCIRSQCDVLLPRGVASTIVTMDIPQNFILGAGDALTLTVLNATHRLGSTGPTDSPTIRSGFGNMSLSITTSDADAIVTLRPAGSIVANEGDRFVVVIDRQTIRGGVLDVDWAVVGSASDVTPEQGSVVFLAGEATKTISLQAVQDTIPELNETYTFSVVSALSRTAGALVARDSRSATIIVPENDDPHGVFAFTAASDVLPAVAEGSQVTVEVARSGGHFGRVNVTFSLASTTAVRGVDYTVLGDVTLVNAATGTYSMVFEDQQVLGTLIFEAIDDATPQLAKFVNIVLLSATYLPSAAVPYTALPPRVAGIRSIDVEIAESENPRGILGFATTSVSVDESAGAVSIEVTRVGGALGRVTCRFTTTPGDGRLPAGAAATGQNVDFTTISGAISFEDGVRSQNIVIALVDDTVPEEDEVFAVLLSNPGNGAVLDDTRASVSVIIRANDDVNGVIGFTGTPQSTREGTVLQIPVQRTAGTVGSVSAQWQVRQRPGSLSFSSSTDVSPASGTVTFASGAATATIFISIPNDGLAEIAESFDVVLVAGSTTGGATLSATTTTTVTIEPSGNPHGSFGFACASRYGGANANGQADDIVTLTVERLDGTIGATSVQVVTTGEGTASSSEFSTLNATLTFEHGETEKTVQLQTKRLVGLQSTTVQVILARPSGGAVLNLTAATATVTIYSSTATSAVLGSIQRAVCDLEPVAAAAGSSSLLTQIEFDSYVAGINDLLSGSLAQSTIGQDLIESLFTIILDPLRLSDDVRNNRNVPSVLEVYALLKHRNADVAVLSGARTRRQTVVNATCTADRDSTLRIGTNAIVSSHTRQNGSSLNAMSLASDSALSVKHVVQLPPLVYTSASSGCATLTHITFSTTAVYPTTLFAASADASATLTEEPVAVFGNRVIFVDMTNASTSSATRAPTSWSNAISYGVGGAADTSVSTEQVRCVWWSAALDNGNGAWTTQNCRTYTGNSTALRSPDMFACECADASATQFAVLIPTTDRDTVAVASQLGFLILACAVLSVLVVYFACHKVRLQTQHFELVIQLFIAIFLTQLLGIISANASKDASDRGSQAIGILVHLTFASQFSWMTAICAYVYVEFIGKSADMLSQPVRVTGGGKFWHYFIFGWGLPIVVMIVYLVSDHSDKENMGDVYGWARDDRSFSLIPKDNDAGVIGAVASFVMLGATAMVVVGLKWYCTPSDAWLTNDDMFLNRANREEIRILTGLFLLVLVQNTFFLLFIFEDTSGWTFALLIMSIVEAFYILVFYAFTTNVRKAMTSAPSAADSRMNANTTANTFYNPAMDVSIAMNETNTDFTGPGITPFAANYATPVSVLRGPPHRAEEFNGFNTPTLDLMTPPASHRRAADNAMYNRSALSAGFQSSSASASGTASGGQHQRMAAEEQCVRVLRVLFHIYYL